MKNFRDIRVRYTHPAIPPMGIKVDSVYTVGHLLDVYKLNETVEVMFTPVDTTWEKLESKNNKKNKEKEFVVGDLEIIDDGTE